MTTIHGDPDLYISRKTKFPTPLDFEKRSIRCGIYPEQVEYSIDVSNASSTLVGDYYINVYGYVQSTFSLVYFVSTKDKTTQIPKVKLAMGQK
jgi:hypothetical protein